MKYVKREGESDDSFEARKERQRGYCRAYYAKDKKYHAERHAKYHAQNRQRLIDYAATRNKENPVAANLANQKLRAKRIKRVPAWYGELDDFVISEALSLCKDRESCTGIKWHLDHTLPLNGKTVSGLHVWNNVQCIPGFLNSHKRNRLIMTEPMQWISHIGDVLK
jgi:hypothetical protein